MQPRAGFWMACAAAACCALIGALAWQAGTQIGRPRLTSRPAVTSSSNAVYWVATITNPARQFFLLHTGFPQAESGSQDLLLVPHEQATLRLRLQSLEEAARVQIVCRPELQRKGFLPTLWRTAEMIGLKRKQSFGFERASFTLVGPDQLQN